MLDQNKQESEQAVQRNRAEDKRQRLNQLADQMANLRREITAIDAEIRSFRREVIAMQVYSQSGGEGRKLNTETQAAIGAEMAHLVQLRSELQASLDETRASWVESGGGSLPVTGAVVNMVVGFYFNSPSSSSYLGTERMDPNLHRLRNEPFAVEVESTFKAMQEHLKDSDDYEIRLSEKFETGHCKAMYKWQTQSFPNCNSVFEQDLTQLRKEQVRLIANGYWRDVWRVQAANDTVALKTLRYVHKISARNFDRHRRDALAMDQLTSSRWIVDIHSYCGNTAIVEYAPGGSLDDSIFSSSEQDYWEPHERLIIAYQVASGVAAVHNTPAEGRAAIAHTDIDTLQFVHITSTGMYKLNDFNRCRFLRWNNDTQQPCGFTVGNNPGTYRSPEEYAYQVQTEKGDVYSMGNVFYSILTRKWPFKDQRNEASSIVKRGGRPPIDEAIRNSTNPFDQAILHAIDLCWVQDPSSRTSARNVQRYFEKRLQELGVKKG
eukprot:Nitzschia sp. Nitz4//scaffold21_size171442//91072//93100//NITZ4_002171-RA/size171442-augustus-gene-0.184-mRNA-1//1//CDS//3329542441//7075//frame0